ncbi:MAG: ATP-binding protein [Oscillospiraceae bacterium]|nr:ATP-binding protein [Oscillospiraceae bacterium]MCL2278106.1 ATP-binding protein [Oscillospiraceae bacterium]
MSFVKSIRAKFMISVLIVALFLTSLGTWFIYSVVGSMLSEEIYERIRTTARLGVLQVDDWFALRSADDAVIAVDFLLPEVLDMVRDIVVIESSYVFLTDEDGYIITHTANEAHLPYLTADNIFIKRNIGDVDEYREYFNTVTEEGELILFHADDGTWRYLTSYLVPAIGWTLHISVPYEYVMSGVNNLLLMAFLFFGVFIIILMALMYLSVTRLISNPLAKVGSFANDVSSGNIHLSKVVENSIDVSSSNEVGVLARILEKSYKQMHNANEIMRTYLNSSPMYIELWDDERTLLEVSRKVEEIFELNDQNEYIRRHSETYPEHQPDGTKSVEKAKAMYDEVLFGEEGIIHYEWVHKKLDSDELVPVDVTLVRTKRDDRHLVIAYNHDLRPIKAALRNEMQATEENRAKTRFLARMSHEMRTPLNAILGIAQIQLRERDLPQESFYAIQNIHNAGSHLLELINDTLDMSMIEMGEMDVVEENYDLPRLINEVCSLNAAYIGAKNIKFILNVSRYLQKTLCGDERRIKQILNNLISNAIKYTSEGFVKLTVSHTVEDDVVRMTFKVEDTGQGIKEEDLGIIFVEYLRLNLDMNRSVEGTGLGLSIAKRLAEIMGGTITVKSTFGKGSTFTASLLQKTAGSEVIGEDMAAQLRNFTFSDNIIVDRRQKVRNTLSAGRVLIVDDMQLNLHVASGLMAPYKLNIEAVKSGFEAIELVENGKEYDIIFMDHMMPEMDGIETMQKLHDMGYTKPIVALTANAMIGSAELFVESGFDEFLAKPIDVRQLDTILNKYIKQG